MSIVKTNAPKAGRSIEVELSWLDKNLAGLVSEFGEEAILLAVKSDMVIGVQALIRGNLERGKSNEEITAMAKAWKPGVRQPGKTRGTKVSTEDVMETFKFKTAEEKTALINALKQMIVP